MVTNQRILFYANIAFSVALSQTTLSFTNPMLETSTILNQEQRLHILKKEISHIDPTVIALSSDDEIAIARMTEGHTQAGLCATLERAKLLAAIDGKKIGLGTFKTAIATIPANPLAHIPHLPSLEGQK